MSRNLFILSADDDTDDQELIEEALQSVMPGHLLRKVTDGLKLLNFLQELSDKKERYPDVILLDLNMPIVSGRDAIGIIKANTSPFREIPVIVLTTSSAKEDVNHCMTHGAHVFLVKPNSFSELKKLLSETLCKFLN